MKLFVVALFELLVALAVASADVSIGNTVLVTREIQTVDTKARSPIPGEDQHWEGACGALPEETHASGAVEDLQDDAVTDSSSLSTEVNICTPGDYACAGGFNGTTPHINICNRSGTWQLSADCGNGHCVEEANGSPHCVAKRSIVEVVPAPNDPLTAEDIYDCTEVGKFSCSYLTARWIFICNPQKRWQQSADCGRDGACRVGADGLPHCHAQKLDDTSSLSARDRYDCNTVGQYVCSENGSQYIMLCNAQKRWVMSADCGRDKGCKWGIDHLPHCHVKVARLEEDGLKEATTLTTVVKKAVSTPKA